MFKMITSVFLKNAYLDDMFRNMSGLNLSLQRETVNFDVNAKVFFFF